MEGIIDFTKYTLIPIEQLVKAPWNYKHDEQEKMAKLVENIRRNGQLENLIVRELDNGKFEVINGNHRLDAFVFIGVKKVICCNEGKISLMDAKRKAIETNETKFRTDIFKLADLMKELEPEFGKDNLAETMPYSPVEIDNFVNMHNFEFPNPDLNEDTDISEKVDIQVISCPHCNKEIKINSKREVQKEIVQDASQ